MKNTILRNAIRRYLTENYGKWTDFDLNPKKMQQAKNAAMEDMKFEKGWDEILTNDKDLSIEDMIEDLEIAKKGKTGHNLQQIQKQLNHLQRLGAGSLNEEEKSEDSTGLEGFLEKMCHKLEKDGVDYAERIKILGKELNKNFDIKKKNISEDSDSLTDKFISGFEKKVPENPSETPEEKQKRIDAKLADLKDKEQTRRKEAGEVEEGVGTGLSIKKGMNVKPTHENINEIIGGQGMFDIHANDIVKLMDKNKTYTDGEFLSIISRYGHGIPTSSMNAITKGLKKSLERKGYKFEPITQEGIGLGLNIKKGMNVKPTHGK